METALLMSFIDIDIYNKGKYEVFFNCGKSFYSSYNSSHVGWIKCVIGRESSYS